jgi:2'-5' RNA ligase
LNRRRLFFALWPDDEVRHALLHWQTAKLPAMVRWQHRADLHMTLHFLGMVDANRLPELERLGDGVRHRAFDFALDHLGFWRKPRVLWCGPSVSPDALTSLHAELAEGLRALGLSLDERAFRPHVTLARKVDKPGELAAFDPIPWSVRELALVESLVGRVPSYEPLLRWPLN